MTDITVHAIPQITTILRDARRNLGLTQTELAKRTGLPRSWINRFEQGQIADPSMQRILTIANDLGVKVNFGFIPKNSPSRSATLQTRTQSTQQAPLPSDEETAQALQAALRHGGNEIEDMFPFPTQQRTLR